jgi:hypothetical protein
MSYPPAARAFASVAVVLVPFDLARVGSTLTLGIRALCYLDEGR